MDTIDKTFDMLNKIGDFSTNPKVLGIFDLIKGFFSGSKSIDKRVNDIIADRDREQNLAALKANLEFLAESNQLIEKELIDKNKELEIIAKNQGTNINITDSIIANNNSNTNFTVIKC